jgi:hypothetical protein
MRPHICRERRVLARSQAIAWSGFKNEGAPGHRGTSANLTRKRKLRFEIVFGFNGFPARATRIAAYLTVLMDYPTERYAQI